MIIMIEMITYLSSQSSSKPDSLTASLLVASQPPVVTVRTNMYYIYLLKKFSLPRFVQQLSSAVSITLCYEHNCPMPLRAGNIDLTDPAASNVLDSLEVSDPHVWDAESIESYDHAPPLHRVYEDLEAALPSSIGHFEEVRMRHKEPIMSSSRGISSRNISVKGQRAGASSRPTVAKQRPKHYKRPTASKFCHICARKSSNVAVAVCSRIEQGLCRKVVCEYCFEKYGWDREALDVAKRMQEKEGRDVGPCKGRKRAWECPHCRGQCVAKAQCNTYGKINYKRHLKLRRKRSGETGGGTRH